MYSDLVYKSLYTGQPGTSVGNMIAPVTNTTLVGGMTLTNTTGTDAVINIYKVPNAGSAGVTNKIYSSYTVKANDTVMLEYNKPMILETGMSLQASQVTNGAITVDINGVVLS